ncbi:guanine nucleotide-binding protein G(I)/G(S)/G(O) subunit gamma-T2 isoform X1 [Serinus canaria]|uniref:guanine nucleotide-binding protein G(I)/G(S)/G(O) subunit gamma-T2 isoform X1 n=1 Tax=Serinus canaria TaxID=9135 RepID=UPI0021CCD63A|nr:guanine nucleotide-binding protein G(I)/G(S)/G(O) subunit gamma-T2 isoform X1 [Serinus canaria]
MSLSRSRSSSDIAPGPAPTSSPPWRFEAAAGADAGPEGAAVSPCPPRGHPALPATSWGPAGRKARGPGRGGDSTGLAARAAGKDFQGAMAQDMTEKELLKMELDQLKKEVKNERQMVSSSLSSSQGGLSLLGAKERTPGPEIHPRCPQSPHTAPKARQENPLCP